MKWEYIVISKMTDLESLPYHLLLDADPSRKMVDDYVSRGETFVARNEDEMIGVYVLIRTRPGTVELVNLAVDEAYQGQGLGKKLVLDAINKAKTMGAKTVELGTGNAGIGQLALYQKCGFRIVGVDRDFFLRHYEEEIYENGMPCIDMIRLALDLESEDA
ncbi:MAG TPA: GNAT family N-acetyltransferase [Bacillales bacterium]|nr:GNAT family N-acetyltransferase [Bacillales bacterium]